MQSGPPLLLVVVLLLAGCLEQPAPTAVQQPGAGTPLVEPPIEPDALPVEFEEPLRVPPTAPPTVSTTPVPPTPDAPEAEPEGDWAGRELPDGTVLHRALRAESGTSAQVAVPERVERLHLVVESNSTFDGEVLLLDPDGRVAASCARRSCEAEATGSLAAGDWSVAFLEVPGDVRVTVVAQVSAELPPSPVHDGPALTYVRNVEYRGGQVNETDTLGIFATSGRVTGRIVVDVEPADRAAVTIMDGSWKPVARCGGTAPAECVIDFSGASARLWTVTYSGDGNGTARVELTHEVDAPDAPPADAMQLVYGGSHNYRTWGDRRGDFANGFVVPAGWGSLLVNVTFSQVGEDDPASTARILLLEPDGDVAGTCEPPVQQCQFRPPATPGRWQVRFEGLDPSRDSRVTALLYAKA